ncbi:hypothetical protein [Solimonas sp. SE-A11]|uniref:hypothetical protein n=1 Tax=Solimonas sp. SE-A11 TaxID=3054954 RepID=UPI00259CE83B|nr:hypothetical protein [Solimonas sp. SE-A11]MDM4770396.1 hypothetical protein [Solimonas sp. SE-A11]
MRLLAALLLIALAGPAPAAGGEKPVERSYVIADFAPRFQRQDQAEAKSAGCQSCHTASDQHTMHANPAVVLGCTDCHGGNAQVFVKPGLERKDAAYIDTLAQAHVLPLYPKAWNWPSSRNPEHSFALLNKEAPEFTRFVNPGDYRVAREACGACHLPIIEAAERSLMSTGAMLWGGAAYNNGILPFKRYVTGESYTREGIQARLDAPVKPDENMQKKGALEALYPLPAWEVVPPADVFRVFERGGRNIFSLFPETANPNTGGNIQRLEEPGRPDIKQSNRGPGTGLRIAVPVLNMHKTRLNDPFSWFLGTNDQPGDYRSSGCSGCHVVYANDRDPRHSAGYASAGHTGKTQTKDPTIPKDEEGHPLKHVFTRAIPTSQCMICHMHQPNIFLNSMLGYTMWDYETGASHMWPKEQKYPDSAEIHKINMRNPEEAAIRGNWGKREFLDKVSELNPDIKDTQFADYHGHGWNFRAIHKRDRKGNLLDKDGNIVADDDPKKFSKTVQMSSIHVDVGMHCVDCHFSQDSHGNGHIYGEVAQAVEIDCQDCHGTADRYPTLKTSGPAAPPGGSDMARLRVQDGRKRFEWRGNKLYQRSALDPKKEWEVSLVKDSVTPGNSHYNEKAARAKLMSKDTINQLFGTDVAPENRAHKDDEVMCITCHTSWTTSCFGCHLPIQANWKTPRNHFEGGDSRNYATYNPQVARDDFYMIGKHGEAKGNRIAPVRSTSALVLSSTNSNRERIYIQQAPVSASGFSSQAFAPHYPHTERKTETKTCEDCHLSKNGDNNAWMTSLVGLGTNFVSFVGFNAWLGLDGAVEAVQVTEWDEPQAVIGSYLHRYAYPGWYKAHEARGRKLPESHDHSARGPVQCLQLRGEYLYAAEGRGGMRAYDVASIANKGFSQRIITAPFSFLGQDLHIGSKNASCVALPTNQPINPLRNQGDLMRIVNQEQPFHPIYHYAVISDAEEGLILVNVDTLQDGEPRNNYLKRALTWNGGGALKGARHVVLAGHRAYVSADAGIVVVNLNDPMKPQIEATIPLQDVRSVAVQFRYLFAVTGAGLQTIDITKPAQPRVVAGALVPLADAHRVHLARTYAYVAAGKDGIAIVDIEKPEAPALLQRYDADGRIQDARDITVGSTNASLFAYVADAASGLHVIQLTAPDTQPKFYGFSPEPRPVWIAHRQTVKPALALSKGLERDRAVDETGHQIAVFGRIGSRPFNVEEMQRLYLDKNGEPWFVSNQLKAVPPKKAAPATEKKNPASQKNEKRRP